MQVSKTRIILSLGVGIIAASFASIIIRMAQAAGMLNKVFPKRKLKEQKKRIEQLTSGQLEGKATKEAVQAVQAAIMVAAIMPAIFVATN